MASSQNTEQLLAQLANLTPEQRTILMGAHPTGASTAVAVPLVAPPVAVSDSSGEVTVKPEKTEADKLRTEITNANGRLKRAQLSLETNQTMLKRHPTNAKFIDGVRKYTEKVKNEANSIESLQSKLKNEKNKPSEKRALVDAAANAAAEIQAGDTKQADAESAFKKVVSNAVAGTTDGGASVPSESKRVRKSKPTKQQKETQTAFTIDEFQQIVATGCAGYDKSAKQLWQAREALASIKKIPQNAQKIKKAEQKVNELREEHHDWLDAYVGFINMLIELSPDNLRKLKRLNVKIEQLHAEEAAEAAQDVIAEKQARKEAKNGGPDYDSGSDDEHDEFEESDEESDAGEDAEEDADEDAEEDADEDAAEDAEEDADEDAEEDADEDA